MNTWFSPFSLVNSYDRFQTVHKPIVHLLLFLKSPANLTCKKLFEYNWHNDEKK